MQCMSDGQPNRSTQSLMRRWRCLHRQSVSHPELCHPASFLIASKYSESTALDHDGILDRVFTLPAPVCVCVRHMRYTVGHCTFNASGWLRGTLSPVLRHWTTAVATRTISHSCNNWAGWRFMTAVVRGAAGSVQTSFRPQCAALPY